MRRSALRLGISVILMVAANALPGRQKRSVDLNEQHKLESACICDDLRPQSYDLEIEPRLAEGKFQGHVRIQVYWAESADKIVLHAHPDLAIADSNVTVTVISRQTVDADDSSEEDASTDKGPVKVSSVERTPRKLLINLEKRLKQGTTCDVSIKYAGNITSNDTSGLFAHHYVDASGQKHTYLATYLRLNNARKLFPGYDELQYKTKFRLALTRPRNMTALSNTPLESSRDVPDRPELVQDHFAQTPEMTSHQLAFVISDLESVAPIKAKPMDGRQLEIRVWGRKEYLDTLKDVPNKIVTIVNYLQDYFNRSIELPKLDVVALPTYMASKASDNWGLMLFKESELSSPLVWNTAYELMYQWIGQSITPFRWMDASENKGLNSFLASMTTLDINPEELKGKWPMNILYSLYYGYGKFYGANRGTGIIRDAKFSKIELVFRMFYYILGKENFKASMQHLIRSQATATPNRWKSDSRYWRTFAQSDIYNSMSFVVNKTKALPAGLTINKVADTWIDQERLPLVTVTRSYDNATITFSQKTYVRENRVSKSNWENVYRWNIPLVMQSQTKWNSSDYAPKAWLLESKDKQNLTIPDIADKNSFVVVNPEEIGLFPVNYDEKNWQLLVDYLRGPNFETIPTLTRAKLLHDAWNLAYADELCFKVALNMTLFLKHEKSHVVWEPFFTMIDHVGGRIEGTEVYAKFQAYARSLLEPMYTEPCELTRAIEPSWKTHLRGLARYFLCRAGYEPCIAEAREQFKKWMTDKEPDKGNPVANEFICPVFKWGTVDEWNFGLQRVINFPRNSPERKQSERTYLLKTLASCPRDPVKVERLLDVALLERNGNFSDADIHLIFSMLASNANGYRSLFNFLRDKWDVAKQRLEGKKSLWTSLVQSATGSFNDQEGYDLVSKLYEARKSEFEGAESFVPEALEKIKQETRWSENNLPAIEKWLGEHLAKPEPADDRVLGYWKEALVCPKRLANETAPAS